MAQEHDAPTDRVTVVLGSQWGDEGKGKLVDIFAAEADVCARCAGGNNAGHTIVVQYPDDGTVNDKVRGKKITYDFHLLPSGLDCKGRLFLSDRAHLVFDFHQIVDGLKEVELGGKSIGTTKKGIGPAYSSKASRSGMRVHHLFDHEVFSSKFRKLVEGRFKRYGHFDYDTEGEIVRYKELADRLRPYVIDSLTYVHKALEDGKRVLVEGANALMLDIDFGTYPFVTSSSTSVGGVCTGLGIPPRRLDIGKHLQSVGAEVGVTTGRVRRCGWLDLVVLQHSNRVNGYDALNLTKLDVLDGLDEIKVAVGYVLDGNPMDGFPANLDTLEQPGFQIKYETLPGWKEPISSIRQWEKLPEACRSYVQFIERFLGVPVKWIGVGPGRDAMIIKP
ncbi:Adenylosuccinate synthetase [Rhizoctonia solani]|uniref:Adenylosuccinate synthetase n=1 Tax=Rhizoctonia solani TaxID=456999 RepID=A0A8H7IBP2_9AGAM|nr:Adenylosuccinate synthetase [Rhizoctonia solani]